MNPAFLDEMSWEMAEVYGAVSDRILINLAKYFPFFNDSNLPASSFAYQAQMLAQMGNVNRDTVRIIRSGLSDADDALERIIEQAIIDSVRSTEPELARAVKRGLLRPPGMPVTVAPNQTRAFQLYYQQAAQKLNLVNTVMLESTRQAYQATVSDIVSRVQATQTALDIGAGETITGVSTWNQAMRHSINRMKEKGITGFIDHGGHRWSAEAYAAMDIRTTVANTARAAVWETNQNFGNDLYLVSYHDGARPLCFPWQNKVISSTDDARTTFDLDGNEIPVYRQSDTSYGEPAGLFGINCKHYPTPFIPGVSLLYDNKDIQSEEANAETYEQSQEQRSLERRIREQKRDLMMLKAQGAPDDVIAAQREEIKKTSAEIDDFCASTGRHRRANREGVYTARSFPAADTYDVATFEREQQKLIRDYYASGGAQQGYTFGQMTPKQPIVPQTPATPATPPPQPQTPQSTFTPATTRAEAEAYGKKFAVSVNYGGNISIDAMNGINRQLTELTDKYPINKLGRVANNGRLKTANARANGGLLEVQGSVFKASNVPYSVDAYHASARRTVEQLERMFPNGIPKGWQQSYKSAQETLKFSRWSISSQYGTMVATIPHEYGHILADQYFGQINGTHFCKDALTPEAREKVRIVKEAFSTAKRTGDIYKISQYASSDVCEFFAEVFAGKWCGESYPDYIEEMLVNVL